MGFLRRFLGGESAEAPSPELDDAEVDAAEEAYQRELLREEHERLTELTRRQLRYAEHAWKPPDQGGGRRADDADDAADDA
jgi:hypothetical protein